MPCSERFCSVKLFAINELTGREISLLQLIFGSREFGKKKGLQRLSIQLGIVTSQKTNHLGEKELYEFLKPVKLFPAVLSTARNYLTAFTADVNVKN